MYENLSDPGIETVNPKKTKRTEWSKMKNPFIIEPTVKREGKIIDYISEFRKKREEGKPSSKTPVPFKNPPILDWKQDLDNEKLPSYYRKKLVAEKAKRIDDQAFKKELVLKHLAGSDALNAVQEVDAMIANSIEAKLSIL